MRYSLISLLFLLLLVSCTPRVTKGLLASDQQVSHAENGYFADPEEDYVYKMRMEVYGRFFGGILVVKKVGEQAHRFVLTSEFGSRIFDFTFSEGAFVTDHIMDGLDKKIIIRTLQSDLRLMSREQADVISIFSDTNGGNVLETAFGKRKAYYFYNLENELDRIVLSGRSKEKMSVDFKQMEKGASRSITISHSDMKMSMDLTHLDNGPTDAD